MKAIWLKAACAAALMLLAGCEEETTLYSQLEERQANAIVAELKSHDISCRKTPGEEGTWNVMIDESKMLYVDPNKNRTTGWLYRNRLQLPLGITSCGSADKVALVYQNIKENGSKCRRRGSRLCRRYCRCAYTHSSRRSSGFFV